ncbi:hypothetical protein [uncultured Microscilla sp.]|uniref:hypothetical protein n=1 Tax=uncultured Microscilla sp. TaxID=432653 RepID=UPI002605789B|nr:hypothetical protein [uncultured Microscilla sp.]
MKTISRLLLSILCAMVLLSSCKKADDPAPATNEEELITDLTLTFTNQANTSEVITMTFSDSDGPNGPQTGTFNISGNLSASAKYNVAFKVENKSETPAEDVTTEIKEEGAEHQVFYNTTGNLQFQSYTDKDANGNPIGISTTFSTGIAGTATLKVTLKHQPGVKTASTTVVDGETDIEVNFTGITIQ